MFFRQFHIVQSVSTGEFLTSPDANTCIFTADIRQAGQFTNLSDAIDTAHNELLDDFCIFSFYKSIDLDVLPMGAAENLQAAPLGNTGGKE